VRRVVAAVGRHVFRFQRVHRLCDMGRLLERVLRVRSVPLADVLAAPFRAFAPLVVWRTSTADVVAALPPLFRGRVGSLGTCGVPSYLLLLSRGLLQSVLG